MNLVPVAAASQQRGEQVRRARAPGRESDVQLAGRRERHRRQGGSASGNGMWRLGRCSETDR